MEKKGKKGGGGGGKEARGNKGLIMVPHRKRNYMYMHENAMLFVFVPDCAFKVKFLEFLSRSVLL